VEPALDIAVPTESEIADEALQQLKRRGCTASALFEQLLWTWHFDPNANHSNAAANSEIEMRTSAFQQRRDLLHQLLEELRHLSAEAIDDVWRTLFAGRRARFFDMAIGEYGARVDDARRLVELRDQGIAAVRRAVDIVREYERERWPFHGARIESEVFKALTSLDLTIGRDPFWTDQAVHGRSRRPRRGRRASPWVAETRRELRSLGVSLVVARDLMIAVGVLNEQSERRYAE
jgi:hypothetical protein